jgi:kumamolisin
LLYKDVEPGKLAPGFRDVTAGDNQGYPASPGWDPCTGLGSPDGAALLSVLRQRLTS